MRLCISKSAATRSSSSSRPSTKSSLEWKAVLFLFCRGLHKFSVGSCLALAVDFDQSIGIMFPKFPVIVHQTWHSFIISSCDRTCKKISFSYWIECAQSGFLLSLSKVHYHLSYSNSCRKSVRNMYSWNIKTVWYSQLEKSDIISYIYIYINVFSFCSCDVKFVGLFVFRI